MPPFWGSHIFRATCLNLVTVIVTSLSSQKFLIVGAILSATITQTAFASDSRIEEVALAAGCAPAKVEEVNRTEGVVTWKIHCLRKDREAAVVTCSRAACRLETRSRPDNQSVEERR